MLNPLLYSLFIQLNPCAQHQFYYQVRNNTKLIGLINNDNKSAYRKTEHLAVWSANNHLALNTRKTKYLWFSKSPQPHTHPHKENWGRASLQLLIPWCSHLRWPHMIPQHLQSDAQPEPIISFMDYVLYRQWSSWLTWLPCKCTLHCIAICTFYFWTINLKVLIVCVAVIIEMSSCLRWSYIICFQHAYLTSILFYSLSIFLISWDDSLLSLPFCGSCLMWYTSCHQRLCF